MFRGNLIFFNNAEFRHLPLLFVVMRERETSNYTGSSSSFFLFFRVVYFFFYSNFPLSCWGDHSIFYSIIKSFSLCLFIFLLPSLFIFNISFFLFHFISSYSSSSSPFALSQLNFLNNQLHDNSKVQKGPVLSKWMNKKLI